MDTVKIIELKEDVLANNFEEAEKLRKELKERNIYLVNVMSSPGSGKTTTLKSLIEKLKNRYTVGVLEADIDGNVDAIEIAKSGVKAVQLHTGGMCHLDASMTRRGIRELGGGIQLIFLENVGNLVCPAEYDTGAQCNMTILSVPEGDDKPQKYPLIYQVCDTVVINKVDVMEYFDFDLDWCARSIHIQNPEAKIFKTSAKTGEGILKLARWIEERYLMWKEG